MTDTPGGGGGVYSVPLFRRLKQFFDRNYIGRAISSCNGNLEEGGRTWSRISQKINPFKGIKLLSPGIEKKREMF